MSQTCPCGTGKTYENCCAPFHGGKNPATAEELLRARYSAFVKVNVPYILATHHSETRKDVKEDEIAEWSRDSKWIGLEVGQQQGGTASDPEGIIDFQARYQSADGKEHNHHERSLFKKENGVWKFFDAQGIQTGPYQREDAKVGRNDPCPCGSGKKFKKCHAA